ncbi:hypothetical protein G6F59_014790 [Rhizopus arrhizus]|nr:hypothetical protein G6F59_014790 [Rhizopus arrhizus]
MRASGRRRRHRTHPYRNRLGRRGAADAVVVVQRQQWIQFGVVAGQRAARHRVVQYGQAIDAPAHAIAADRLQADLRLLLQPTRQPVLDVHEQHHAIVVHAAVAVVQAIDGGVVLVVAAQRRQFQAARFDGAGVLQQPLEGQEFGLARLRFPDALGGRQGQAAPTRLQDASRMRP